MKEANTCGLIVVRLGSSSSSTSIILNYSSIGTYGHRWI